jgi:hypothetical protein
MNEKENAVLAKIETAIRELETLGFKVKSLEMNERKMCETDMRILGISAFLIKPKNTSGE